MRYFVNAGWYFTHSVVHGIDAGSMALMLWLDW
jgi:hypothetical protein